MGAVHDNFLFFGCTARQSSFVAVHLLYCEALCFATQIVSCRSEIETVDLGQLAGQASIAEEEDEEDAEELPMSQLCPLYDDVLPISASALRLKQVCPASCHNVDSTCIISLIGTLLEQSIL